MKLMKNFLVFIISIFMMIGSADGGIYGGQGLYEVLAKKIPTEAEISDAIEYIKNQMRMSCLTHLGRKKNGLADEKDTVDSTNFINAPVATTYSYQSDYPLVLVAKQCNEAIMKALFSFLGKPLNEYIEEDYLRNFDEDEKKIVIQPNFNVISLQDKTPLLHIAVWADNLPFTLFLLDQKSVDVNKDVSGYLPLHRVARKKDEKWVSVAKKLVERGADVDSTYNYSTALAFASSDDNIAMVNALLELGADPNAGNTALASAASKKRVEVAKILLKHPKTDPNQGEGLTIAAKEGYKEIIAAYLERGDLEERTISNAINGSGWKWWDLERRLKEIKEKKAHIERQSGTIRKIVLSDHLLTPDEKQEYKAAISEIDPNAEADMDESGWKSSVFEWILKKHDATYDPEYFLITEFLKKKPNLSGTKGDNFFTYASPKSVRLLLEAGAIPSDNAAKNILRNACYGDDLETIKAVVDKLGKVPGEAKDLIDTVKDHPKIMVYLAQQGMHFDPDQVYRGFMGAADKNLDDVKLLERQFGIPTIIPGRTASGGWSSLVDISLYRGHPDIAAYFVLKGAEYDKKDAESTARREIDDGNLPQDVLAIFTADDPKKSAQQYLKKEEKAAEPEKLVPAGGEEGPSAEDTARAKALRDVAEFMKKTGETDLKKAIQALGQQFAGKPDPTQQLITSLTILKTKLVELNNTLVQPPAAEEREW